MKEELLKSENLPWSFNSVPPTPFYLYSQDRLKILYQAFLKHTQKSQVKLHYALKANSNPRLLSFFKSQGAGLDLVSGGEYKIAHENGFHNKELIFSGVGKTRQELKLAVQEELSLVIVESRAELEALLEIAAELQKKVSIGIRVNPDVDAGTHPYITTGLYENKFGVDFTEARELYRKAQKNPWAQIQGMSLHIGSQMLDLSALKSALEMCLVFAKDLKSDGLNLKTLDAGGGLGISYNAPLELPPFLDYGKILEKAAQDWRQLQGPEAQIYCEIGRALVAQGGFLVSRVIRTKKTALKNFAILDASMTELLRPALYQAQHPISLWSEPRSSKQFVYEIVGPVCESADFLGRSRLLPELYEGDILRIDCAGAYGAVMASQYNARPLPQEIWWP